MSLMSFVGALVAFSARPRVVEIKEPGHDLLIKRIAELEHWLAVERDMLARHIEANAELEDQLEVERCIAAGQKEEIALLRQDLARERAFSQSLIAGAHRCQHQADLNRALAEQQLAQMQSYQAGLLQAGCRLARPDCNMHRAEMQQAWAERLNAIPADPKTVPEC